MSGQPLTIGKDGLVTSVGSKPCNEKELQLAGTKNFMNGRITVQKRSDDYIAYLDGNLRNLTCGKTVAEAVGNLVISHM